MPASELTNTQALIDRYYTEEKEKRAQALTRAELHLQLDANDLAMLSTIAKRFGKSRDDLAKDVLSHALIDLLTQIEPGERKLIARDADEMAISMAREIAEENGIKDVDHKSNVWTGHDRTIAKAEKKRAKELEDAKKQAGKDAKLLKSSGSKASESTEVESMESEPTTAESNASESTVSESSTSEITEVTTTATNDENNQESVITSSESSGAADIAADNESSENQNSAFA